ncbi:thermonuclease family protein [Viridibacillus sp. YIM B01967]|uniref:Thermonuclease family protein n=1 Tax=Viridibacillus soli TaxID=2798301 RepID=A0ABS1H651_9BACL|nr:thermonuclease family protein [Viridibacillus soli]MBK3494637.1 thermonuclease family protein [Viridibacillus soli]
MQKLLKLLVVMMIFVLGFTGFAANNIAEAKAGKKFTDKLVKCVDGDTAYFKKAGKSRFLYVDTPESTNKIEAYGKTASKYTCNKLKSAKKIQLQYDGTKKDKYGRTLVWVWVDGKLLQKLLVQKGYVKKFYDYGTYSYESELVKLQKKAQKDKVGLWSKKKESVTIATTNKTNFKNCTELRKYYPNGVPKSHKAYQAKMDRDKDGYACER